MLWLYLQCLHVLGVAVLCLWSLRSLLSSFFNIAGSHSNRTDVAFFSCPWHVCRFDITFLLSQLTVWITRHESAVSRVEAHVLAIQGSVRVQTFQHLYQTVTPSAGNDMRFLPEQPEQPEKIGVIRQKTAESSG